MAAADRAAIAGGIPSLDLMERAGRAVARAALRLAGGAYGRRIVVACGRGNNAGDGFVAARHLARAGAYPLVVLIDGPEALAGDARMNFERLKGIRVRRFDPGSFSRELERASAVIDALVGTGFRGALEGPMGDAVELINRSSPPVVAVDIPSGVDGGSGRVTGSAVRATLTVTMAALKAGLVIYPGSEHAGEIEVADIGIGADLIESDLRLVEGSDVAALLPRRPPDAHKKGVGYVMVVAGSVGMSGAAALAAAAALRSGAGLVTIAAPASVALALDQAVLEATTLPLPETGRGTIEASAVDAVLERAGAVDAVAIGPGLTTDAETVEFVRKLVSDLDRPLVIDADAINALSGDPEALAGRSSPTLATPHPGELARLLGTGTADIQADRLGAARAAARRTRATVLLKGYRTVVAPPSGPAAIVDVGGPALATGGSGDVLTGVALALLAATKDAFSAGWSAAWLHGSAGDLLAKRRGDRGVVAGDLIDAVPEVLRSLEETT